MTADDTMVSGHVVSDSPKALTSPDRRTWLGLAVVLLAAFMELLDVTVAAPDIQNDLGTSYAQVSECLQDTSWPLPRRWWPEAGSVTSWAVGAPSSSASSPILQPSGRERR